MQGGINGPNQVQSLRAIGKYKHRHLITMGFMLGLLKELLLTRNESCTWIGLERGHIWGLVSAHMRLGPRTWEIDHIFHATKRDANILELVDDIIADLGQCGVTRVFLRLPELSPLIGSVSQSGFLIYKVETLHYSPIASQSISDQALPGLRARFPRDDHSLLRLYNASMPARLRAFSGLTNEEWRDSRERFGKDTVELVYEYNSTLLAWLRFLDLGKSLLCEMLVPPEHGNLIPKLVAESTEIWKEKESIYWLTADHQPSLSLELRQRGFLSLGNYTVMVKPVAGLVKEPYLATVSGVI